jgi:hypothetical protein
VQQAVAQIRRNPMSDYKPGDHVRIKVGERFFDTVFDKHGVQRFHTDKIISDFIEGTTAANDVYNANHRDFHLRNVEFFTLNDLGKNYERGHYTQDEFLTFYTSFGYSVAGFADISHFEDLEIVNPVWGDKLEPEALSAEDKLADALAYVSKGTPNAVVLHWKLAGDPRGRGSDENGKFFAPAEEIQKFLEAQK